MLTCQHLGITTILPIEELPHNTHDKNHLLAQAIKNVVGDHIKNQQSGERADYSFEYWEYIFYLMGVLEPPPRGEKHITPNDNLQLQTTRSGLEEWRDGKGMLDWLHGKNPLNVSETLTEWMLLALVEKLELELLELRRKMGNTPAD